MVCCSHPLYDVGAFLVCLSPLPPTNILQLVFVGGIKSFLPVEVAAACMGSLLVQTVFSLECHFRELTVFSLEKNVGQGEACTNLVRK